MPPKPLVFSMAYLLKCYRESETGDSNGRRVCKRYCAKHPPKKPIYFALPCDSVGYFSKMRNHKDNADILK